MSNSPRNGQESAKTMSVDDRHVKATSEERRVEKKCSHPKRYLDEGQIKRCGVHETTKSSKNLRCYRQDGKLYPGFQPKVSNISKNVHQITVGA